MTIGALQWRSPDTVSSEARMAALISYLRTVVLAPGVEHERCHAVFLDERNCGLGDASVGMGNPTGLSLRMREIFGEALRLDARGMILAHNHPSGHCRPSGYDIAATRRLSEVSRALDIELVDHLIFTRGSVYSMRAGGML